MPAKTVNPIENITKKPRQTVNGRNTFHGDGTVSFWDPHAASWERRAAIDVPSAIFTKEELKRATRNTSK